jgi:hypothetical protein
LSACGSSSSGTLYPLAPPVSAGGDLATEYQALVFDDSAFDATPGAGEVGLTPALDVVSTLMLGTLTAALTTADDYIFIPARHPTSHRALTSQAFIFQTDGETVSGVAQYDPDNAQADDLNIFTVVGPQTKLNGQFYAHHNSPTWVDSDYTLAGTDNDPSRGGSGLVKYLEYTDGHGLITTFNDRYELRSPATNAVLYASDFTNVATDDADTGLRSETYAGKEIYDQPSGYWVAGNWNLSDPDVWATPNLRIGQASYVASDGVHYQLNFDNNGALTGTVVDSAGNQVATLAMDANLNIYLVDPQGNPVHLANGNVAYLTVSFLTPINAPSRHGGPASRRQRR